MPENKISNPNGSRIETMNEHLRQLYIDVLKFGINKVRVINVLENGTYVIGAAYPDEFLVIGRYFLTPRTK